MLSVIVLAKNEEKMIKACLESVKWADEIIVVDNGSSDNTSKIVKEYTDKIIYTDILNFAEVRNKAIEKAKGDWVLYIDADERVLESLKLEILGLVVSGKKAAYALSRRNIIFGQEVNYGPYINDWVIRLLNKDKFKKWIGRVHEYATFNGELGYTKNSLLHLTHRDVDHFLLKALEWSKIDAKLRLDSGHPKMSGWRFLRIFISETFNQGVKRGGFFNGTVSMMDSLLQVFSMYITYVRLWQMQQSKPTDEIYKEIDKKLLENEFRY
jgi:hypothetical protein